MPEMRGASEGGDHLDPDPALERAIDSFVDWARDEGGLEELDGLPDPSLFEPDAPRRIGDFELLRKLGVGGSGVVWEARQVSVNGRRVAVKFLRQLFAARSAGQRFQREIETIARLDHRAIVPIVSAGIERGLPYFAMKYVEGLSVAQLLDRLRERPDVPTSAETVRRALEEALGRGGEDGASAPQHEGGAGFGAGFGAGGEQSYVRWVARVGLELAQALQHAHEHGVVHRDVKPGNVVIDAGGRPVLLDFGLALVADGERLSQPDRFLGSLPYSPPEQVRGTPVDTRADVYSLGATLYELLSLRRPFDAAGETDLARRIQEDDPPAIGRHVPADLRTVICCALAKSPARRYATPGAMAHDLREFLAGRPIQARPPGAWARAARFVRRHPKSAVVAAAVLILLAAVHGRDRRKAALSVAEARALVAELRGDMEERRSGIAEYDAIFEQIRPQRTRPDPREVERRRDALSEGRAALASTFAACEAQCRLAFDFVGSYGPARALLGELYAEELRQALRDALDVRDRDGLKEIEARLAEYASAGHARLLDPTGDVEIDCPHPGASVRLEVDGAVYAGPAPLRVDGLEEGTYFAELSAPGRSAARLPILVRRRAVHDEPGALPPTALEVELLLEGEALAGYAYVAPGWTLVEDEPPRWVRVEGFQMKTLEISYAEWLEFLDGMESISQPIAELMRKDELAYRPRSADRVLHVARADEDAPWRIVNSNYAAPDWPVRGLKGSEMSTYAMLEASTRPAPAGWYYGLPRTDEFIRAARGCDARPFVWGSEWDEENCACYRPSSDALVQAEPYPVGTHPADVSVFGVHDLAGSLAEFSSDSYGVAPDVAAYFGGTYREHHQETFRTTALRGGRDEPHDERGFRLVLRPIPAALQPWPVAEHSFRDDFERDGSHGLGRDWIELVGSALTLRPAWDASAGASIEGGRLVCRGGQGNGSLTCRALHPVRDPGGDFRLLARLRGGWSSPQRDQRDTRVISLLLSEGPLMSQFRTFSLSISTGGDILLSTDAPAPILAESVVQVSSASFDDHWLELQVVGGLAQARVWPADQQRPHAPQLETSYPLSSVHFAGVQAPNLVGGWLALDELSFEPLD